MDSRSIILAGRQGVFDLLDDLNELKTGRATIELEISQTKMEIDKAMVEVAEKVTKLRSKLGIEFNSDTFRVG